MGDIRKVGSGNAGTTNVLRVMGVKTGLIVFVLDILKALIACIIGRVWMGLNGAMVAGLAVVLGHNWPCFFQFKGGKGVLCGLASLLMVDWRIGLLVVVVFAIVVAICKRVSLGSICACASAPVWCLLLGVPTLHTVYVLLAASWLIWCHRSNIKRLLRGEEPKTVIAKRKPR